MANLFLGLNPYTITDIDTKQTTLYNDFKEAFNVAIDGKNDIYIYDLFKLEETIANYLTNELGYKIYDINELKSGLKSELPESKSYFTVGSKTEKTCTFIKVKKTARKTSKIYNVKSKFGDAKLEDIASTFGCSDNIELGVACALDWLKDNGHTSYTLASDAFADLKNECFGRMVDGKKQYAFSDFKEVFPTLYGSVHDFCIKGLQGGLCLINPKYQGETEVAGTSYDVNSMYPSVMLDERLPIGTPVYFKGELNKKTVNGFEVLYFQRMKIAKIKLKEGYYPCVKEQVKNGDYIIEAEDIELNLSHIAMKIMFMSYDVEGIEYIDGYKFRSKKGLFDNYINKWMKKKEEAVDGSFERMYAKLMLNSSFGKFISKNNRRRSEWFVVKIGKNKGKLQKRKCIDRTKVEGNSVYAPVGCYITDYARLRLLETIYANKDNFIYSDTDSIYVKGEAVGLEIDSKKVGAWKEEFKFTRMNIVGKKQYCVQKDNGHIKVVLAGCPDAAASSIIEYNDFFLDKEIDYTYKSYDLNGEEHINTSKYRLRTLDDIDMYARWENFITN